MIKMRNNKFKTKGEAAKNSIKNNEGWKLLNVVPVEWTSIIYEKLYFIFFVACPPDIVADVAYMTAKQS